jgi:hypothetical protein
MLMIVLTMTVVMLNGTSIWLALDHYDELSISVFVVQICSKFCVRRNEAGRLACWIC